MPAVLVGAAVAAWLVAGVRLAVTDLRTGLLPTRVIWPTAAVVWVLYTAASLVEAEPAGLIGAAVGGAACGALLATVHLVHPPSMGFGFGAADITADDHRGAHFLQVSPSRSLVSSGPAAPTE